jgi:phospholipid/cholesterol/gamma-HCH transport system permease protein
VLKDLEGAMAWYPVPLMSSLGNVIAGSHARSILSASVVPHDEAVVSIESLPSETTDRGIGVIGVQQEDRHAQVKPEGRLDLDSLASRAPELEAASRELGESTSIDLDLSGLEAIDGAGAVMLARWIDVHEEAGRTVRVLEVTNPQAARLIALYRERREPAPDETERRPPLARLGAAVAAGRAAFLSSAGFLGSLAAALPAALRAPRSVNWGSMPGLLQGTGADALPVTAAANLLVGFIIGALGVTQLARFGATGMIPELLVVIQFRELGPLITAVVVAGRSGAGIASEVGAMKVSEEIDALSTMGFDPLRWLVLPRCLALIIVVPLLTWIGYATSVLGCMVISVGLTDMTPRIFMEGIGDALSLANFLPGLIKTPFLAFAVGVIASEQGLATRGGAVAVGARTTTAVVASMFAVIVISTIFTIMYTVLGV